MRTKRWGQDNELREFPLLSESAEINFFVKQNQNNQVFLVSPESSCTHSDRLLFVVDPFSCCSENNLIPNIQIFWEPSLNMCKFNI